MPWLSRETGFGMGELDGSLCHTELKASCIPAEE